MFKKLPFITLLLQSATGLPFAFEYNPAFGARINLGIHHV